VTPSLALLGLFAERASRATAVPPFPIPAGAENIVSRMVEGNEEWRWMLRRAYPAPNLLEHYSRHAAGLGWTLCVPPRDWESWFESDLRRTQFMVARVWENAARAEAVLLFLRYFEPGDAPVDTPGSDILHVHVLLVPITQPLERLARLT